MMENHDTKSRKSPDPCPICAGVFNHDMDCERRPGNNVLDTIDQCPTCGHDRYGWGDSLAYFGRAPWCPYDDEADHPTVTR